MSRDVMYDGLLCRTQPLRVTEGIGQADHDAEGRVITAEYSDLHLVTAYVPNAGQGLKRLDYRVQEWDAAFAGYIAQLAKTKPVILAGDLNCAHQEIDIHNPKGNKKQAGFTDVRNPCPITPIAIPGFSCRLATCLVASHASYMRCSDCTSCTRCSLRKTFMVRINSCRVHVTTFPEVLLTELLIGAKAGHQLTSSLSDMNCRRSGKALASSYWALV